MSLILVMIISTLISFNLFLQALFNLLGLICFNAFPERSKLKGSPLLAPFLCLRVVTRGDYPDLVRQNVNRNLTTCLRVGLEKFMIEVVTDKTIDLPENQRIRQVSSVGFAAF